MNKTEHAGQSLTAKKAEAMQRPFYGEKVLTHLEIRSINQDRANKALVDAVKLSDKGIPLGPFLEIGAGMGQRSIAIMNKFSVLGVASDISQNYLRNAPYTLSLLGYNNLPVLICCDAQYLPFLPDTFQLIFVYEALHHFEDPAPVVSECYRVLGQGGFFYFNEEPMDSSLRRFLRGNRVLSHPPTRIQNIGYRLHVQKLFWDDGAHERSLGMNEARFDIDTWRSALLPFKEVKIEVNSHLKIQTNLYRPFLPTLLSSLVGGNVEGLCRKTAGKPAEGDFREKLMCLDCGTAGLIEQEECLYCQECSRSYPIIECMIRMLPKELEASLYA